MKVRSAAAIFGALFGFLISWGQFADPDRIRQMLLLEDPYLYEMMAAAVAVGFVGLRLLQRRRTTALLGRRPLEISAERIERRHVAGAALFGVGWAITDSCPAPIAAQLAQGVAWSLFTLAGVLVGIQAYLRLQDARLSGGAEARLASMAGETAQGEPGLN